MADAARDIPRLTAKEYLEIENDGTLKHEFVNGIVYAMAGGSRRHNAISNAMLVALDSHLPDRCQVYSLDVKVHIQTRDEEQYFYPDVFVTCSELDNDAYSSNKPIIIIEVISPTTETFDRGTKFDAYRSLMSLQEYALVAQDSRRLELFRRRSNWQPEVFVDDDIVPFESIDLTIPIASLYRRIAL